MLITGSAKHTLDAVFIADDGVLRFEGGTRIYLDMPPVPGDTHAVLLFETGYSLSFDNSVCDYHYGSLDSKPPLTLQTNTALGLLSDLHTNLYLCPLGYLRATTPLPVPAADKADLRYTCHVSSADTPLLHFTSESASLADSWYVLRPHGRLCRVPHADPVIKESLQGLSFDNLLSSKDREHDSAWSEAADQYYLSRYSWGTLGIFDALLSTGSGELPRLDTSMAGDWAEIFPYDYLPATAWNGMERLDLASSSTYDGLLNYFDYFMNVPWGAMDVFSLLTTTHYRSLSGVDGFQDVLWGREVCYLVPWITSAFPDGGALALDMTVPLDPKRFIEVPVYPAPGFLYETSRTVAMDGPRRLYHDAAELLTGLPAQSASSGFSAVYLFEDESRWYEGDELKSYQHLGTPITGFMNSACDGLADFNLIDPLRQVKMVPSKGCYEREQDNYPNPPAPVIVIPHPLVIKRSLQLMSTASLIRASDNAPIPVTGMSLSTDLQSWCWSFNAAIKTAAALELCKPTSADPVELIATVNDYSWRVLIDGFNERGAFGKTDYSISGRTKAVELASPMAEPGSRVFDTAMNLSQIFEQELLRIQGVNDGEWTGVWEAQDGLIPAGTFSYQDKTPIEVIVTLAQAVGAFVHHDRMQRTITVSPCYQKSPWDFTLGDEDHALHPSSVISTGMAWKPTPVKDGIYVSGTTSDGYLCKVSRNGSGGLKLLPMITDPLIVTAAIARERGRFAINQAGKKGEYSKELPILAPDSALPLLETGRVVRVDDAVSWYGVVTGLSVGVSMSNNVCKARQQVSIERHFE